MFFYRIWFDDEIYTFCYHTGQEIWDGDEWWTSYSKEELQEICESERITVNVNHTLYWLMGTDQ
jgi:hypothetical protein